MEMNDRNGKGDCRHSMFKRKKKKTKDFLLSCLKELSLTTEEQTTIIRTLTEQNNQHSQDSKNLQDTIVSITKEIQLLHDRNADLDDKLESTESQLMVTEKELVSGKERDRLLDETNTELGELQMQVTLYQERLISLDEKNEMLSVSVAELKDALKESQSEHAKLKVNFKMLEKDLLHCEEIKEYENKARLETESRLADIMKTLDNVKRHEYSVQRDLDAENECLKFDVKTLRKKLKKMKEVLDNMHRDKLLIMSYYTRQQQEKEFDPKRMFHVNVSGRTKQKLSIDTADGFLVPNNLGVKDEIHPDVLENFTLQNKLMNMENRIYWREQQIDELVRLIQEHDPHFNLQDEPSLQLYLDGAKFSVTKKQTNYPDKNKEQFEDCFSSTISSDNLNESHV